MKDTSKGLEFCFWTRDLDTIYVWSMKVFGLITHGPSYSILSKILKIGGTRKESREINKGEKETRGGKLKTKEADRKGGEKVLKGW